MADNDEKPNGAQGGIEVSAGKTIKVETDVKVKDLPEFRAEIDAEKKRVKELEDKLKIEQDARQKAEQEKTTALTEKATYDEEKRQAKIIAVKTKYGDTLPDEALKVMSSEALDKLDQTPPQTPPATSPPTPPPEPEKARSKAPPNTAEQPSPPAPRKKKPILNKDGMADPIIQTKAERDAGKHRKEAIEKCEAIEGEIAREIRKGYNLSEEDEMHNR